MASLDIQRLWKLHKIDAGLIDIRNKAAALDPARTLRPELERLKTAEAEVSGKYKTLHQEQTDLEISQKDADAKLKKLNGQLYGGTIVSPKEADAFEKEMATIRHAKDDRDMRLLELYDLIPAAKVAAEKVQKELEAKRQELGDANKRALATKDELQREFARLTKLRPEAAKIVTPTLLARYEAARQRHHGVGMAEVTKKGSCSTCGTNLPERTLQALREDKVGSCEACHRILYYTEGVV